MVSEGPGDPSGATYHWRAGKHVRQRYLTYRWRTSSVFASGRWPRWGRPGHALTTGGQGSVFASGSASTTGEVELIFASDIYHWRSVFFVRQRVPGGYSHFLTSVSPSRVVPEYWSRIWG